MQPGLTQPDRGLQPERTSLAWTRTLYVLLLNSLLFLRVGWLKQLPLITGTGVALLVLTAALLGFKRLYLRRWEQVERRLAPQHQYRLFLLLTIILIMISVISGFNAMANVMGRQ